MSDREPETLEIAGQLQQPHLGRSIDIYREKLTSRLIALFAGTVLLESIIAETAMITSHDFSTVREVVRDIIPAEVSLLGTAIGYYFGVRKK
jgi:hypothetical protein